MDIFPSWSLNRVEVVSLNISHVARLDCANVSCIRAPPCWGEPAEISQHQNCYKDPIRRWWETFFKGDLHTPLHDVGGRVTCVHPESSLEVCDTQQCWLTVIAFLPTGWLAFTCWLFWLGFFLSCKRSVQRSLGTLLESLLFYSMIFSSHMLLDLPLSQFNATRFSEGPLCMRFCVFCSPCPPARSSRSITFRMFPLRGHLFLSACSCLSWASPWPFGSHCLTCWFLLLTAASPWWWAWDLNKRPLSFVSPAWKGTRSWL